MGKKGHRYLPATRADSGIALSCRLACRTSAFRPEEADIDKDDRYAADDCIFLMNHFYGKKIIFPMIECIRQKYAGDIGFSLAHRLEKEMQDKNGCIRGDDLLALLKDKLGLECAVSLIGEMACFGKMGLYGDRILASLMKSSGWQSSEKPLSGQSLSEKSLTKKPSFVSVYLQHTRLRNGVKTDCMKEDGTCRGCMPRKAAKENTNWKKNAKKK